MRRPVFWAAVSMTAGLLLPIADLSCWCWGGFALSALAGAAALALVASNAQAARLACAALVVGFFAAGRVLAAGATAPLQDGIAELLKQRPRVFEAGVTLTGTLARAPRAGRGPRGDAAEVELLVDLQGVEAGRTSLPARGRVRLRLPADGSVTRDHPATYSRGAGIKCFARITLPGSLGNPGAFDTRRHLLAQGIHATGTIKSWRLIEVMPLAAPGARLGMLRCLEKLRRRLLSNLDAAFPRDARGRRAAAVGGALLLGERSGLTPDDALALQEAGLSHLLAVSGFNVAVLSALLLLGLRLPAIPPRLAALTMVPALGLYLLLNQAESSVARAVVMAVTWFAGRAIWRKPDLLSTLGLSALTLLVAQPLQVHEAGFQLTFAATISLIALRFLLPRPLPAAPRPAGPRGEARIKYSRRAARFLLQASAATLAALVGTLPLTIAHFHRVTPGAVPANLVAGPMMAAAFVVLVGLEMASPISTTLSRAAAWCATSLIEATFMVADVVNRWPMMSWRRAGPGLLLHALFAGCLVCLVGLAATGRLRGRLGGLAAAVCLLTGTLLAAPIDTRRAPSGLRVTMLDVGQGDSSLIETPLRGRLLVDAGGSSWGAFDVGERVVSQALWAMGIQSLDAVAVTHDDADHLGGAAAVVANFHPREVWLPEGAQRWPSGRGIERLRASAIEAGASLKHLSRGSSPHLRGAEVLVLNPPALLPGSRRGDLPDNEGSLVLLVRRAGRQALLTGDAGGRTEQALMNLPGVFDPGVDLLKVGHHGSRSSTTGGFLAATRPRVALVSCGRSNRFGHPSPEVVARLAKSGARICRTDQAGAITVELLGGPGRATLLSQSCALLRRGRLIPGGSSGDLE